MPKVGFRSVLASAALGLALGAAPATATSERGYVPGEIVVGHADGAAELEQLAPGTSVAEAIERREADPEIAFARPNWIARAALLPFDRGSSGEPSGWRADQWSFLGRPGGIRVPRAWDRLIAAGAAGGAGATIAVVDTGLAYLAAPEGHAPAPDFLATQFVPGIDLVDDDGLPLDENGHGTHVAGTIAEQVTLTEPSGAADFETGIAYGAQLMPVRVLDSAGAGSAVDVGEGIEWAARNGAEIINVSLQFDAAVQSCDDVPTVCAAVREARRDGAVVIAAAGNALSGEGRAKALFPGAAPGALAVGATTEHGCLAAYSHFGKRTDLLAPGGGLPRPTSSRSRCATDQRPILQASFACFPGGGCPGTYDRFAIRPDLGTSMAAAHTSGVAALVLAGGFAGADPAPRQLERRLECTARPRSPRRFYGPGLLDAVRATNPSLRC